MDDDNEIALMLNSLQNKIEDLEIRVSEVLVKQLQTRKELDLIQERPQKEEDEEFTEEKIEVQFPEDYHFTEDLEKIMQNMIMNQKSWMESVQNSKDTKTGLKGLKIFDEMNKHLSDRLEYLETSKNLIQGPLLEELPAPEEPPVEEPAKEEKVKGKKEKKGKKK